MTGWFDVSLVLSPTLGFSWSQQDQAGDPELLSEVHAGGAGALLSGHAGHVLPV